MFAKRPKSALTGLYVAGVLLSWMLGIGFILLIMAIVAEKNQGKLFAVTTHRLVLLDGSGRETSYWFQNYRDLEPTRRDLNVGGGGLIGGLISAAATAVADARLANQHKLQPQFWTRTIALVFTQHDGRRVTADVGDDGEHVALPVAHVFLGNAGPQMPTFDVRHLAQQPAALPGIGLTIMGALLTFYGLVSLAVVRLGVMRAFGSIGTPFALVLVLVGAALYTLGIFTRLKAKKARGEASSPAVPLALFGVFTTAAVVGAFVYKKKGYDDYDSYRNYPVAPAATTPTGTSTSAKPGASGTARVRPAAAKIADLAPILAKHGVKFDKDHAFDADWDLGVNHSGVSAKDAKGDLVAVDIWDLSHDVITAKSAKVCKLDPKGSAVCVTATNGPDLEKTARALLDIATKKPPRVQADLEAAMRTGGVAVTDRSEADMFELFGYASGAIVGKKGAVEITLRALTFEKALTAPEPESIFRVDGTNLYAVRCYDRALLPVLADEVMGLK